MNEKQISLKDNTDKAKWYVLTVSFRKETAIQRELTSLGFEAYLPMRYQIRKINGNDIRLFEPAIYGMVFVKGEKNNLINYLHRSQYKKYTHLKTQKLTNGNTEDIIIKDNDMVSFQRLNNVQGSDLTYYRPEQLHIEKGSKVKIMEGPFEGITGTVQRLPGKRGQYLIVSLPNVAIAAVSIKPKYIQPIEKTIAKSKDVVKDARKLISKAISLFIDNIAGKKESSKQETKEEINQIHLSLKGCITYLPNDKAYWLLADYAYQIINRKDTGELEIQIRNMLSQLKPNNLIIPYAHILFFIATGNNNELQAIDTIINKWDATKYSNQQKALISIRRKIMGK